jgi:predicted PurR-regulated permease PerM
MPDIDWFSFIAGFIAAIALLLVLAQIRAWLKKLFQPKGDKPFKQRAAETVRHLVTGLLIVALIAMGAYIAYSVLFKPAP